MFSMSSLLVLSLLVEVSANISASQIKSSFSLANAHTKTTSVQCPDGQTYCLDGQTCCPLAATGHYYCCHLPNATCCSGQTYCCPYGYRCNVEGSRCYNSPFHI